MCTVTWIESEGGFQLFHNRDELRSRQPALPPRRQQRQGVAYLAPVDGDFGGTWIAVNEHGTAVCLLNRQPAVELEPSAELVSRGHLVRQLAGAGAWSDAERQLRGLDVERFRPFTLVLLGAGGEARGAIWDGAAFHLDVRPRPPLASSSRDELNAVDTRQRLYAELFPDGRRPSPAALFAFHRSHRPQRGPFSPCMHRAEARTVSFTWVEVSREQVAMAYADGPPCTAPLAPPLTLPRRQGD
jgi:hypothetical protein